MYTFMYLLTMLYQLAFCLLHKYLPSLFLHRGIIILRRLLKMWTLQNRTPLLLTAKVLQLQEGLLGPLEAKKATLHLEDDFTTK